MKTGNTTHGALLCSLVQVVRVVIVRVILVGVRGVTVVHIGHDEVLVVVLKSVAIFVVIFCKWRCTLYTFTILLLLELLVPWTLEGFGAFPPVVPLNDASLPDKCALCGSKVYAN